MFIRAISFFILLSIIGLGAVLITRPMQVEAERIAESIGKLRTEVKALQLRLSEFDQFEPTIALPASLLHRGTTQSEAALSLQRTLVQTAGQNRIVPTSFGVLPPPADLTSPAVAVVLEGVGETEDVGEFLRELNTNSPDVAVSQLSLRAVSGGQLDRGSAPVAIRVVVWGFWSEGET